MNAAIESYQDQLLSIRQEVPGLVANLSEAQLQWSPAPRRWSIAQCFDHLNTTARAFVPAIDRAIEDGRRRGATSPGPFSLPLFERLFLQWTDPPSRLRMRAPRALRPGPGKPAADVLREFMDWQDRLGERIRMADGLDLLKARGRAPAFPLFRWSLGSLFAITLAHERRHLRQVREVRNALK